MTTKTVINLNEVPESIKTSSELYKTLITEFEGDTNDSMGEFEEKHMTFPKTVQTYEDVKTWLNHYRFWMMSELPNEVYEFMLSDVDKSKWLKNEENSELFMGFDDLLWIIQENIKKDSMSEKQKEACFIKGYLNIIKNIKLNKNNTNYYYWVETVGNVENYKIEESSGEMGSSKDDGTNVEEKINKFYVSNAYPNPFNLTTRINYNIEENCDVNIGIYDILGRKIKTLENSEKNTGNYSIMWDGKNENGNNVGKGIYLYQINAGEYVRSGKMSLVK